MPPRLLAALSLIVAMALTGANVPFGVFCLWLWYGGLSHVETWLAGLATAAMPVAALATSAFYLGEAIGPARLAGAALGARGSYWGRSARQFRIARRTIRLPTGEAPCRPTCS